MSGGGENHKSQKGTARNLAAGLKAMPLPGDHNISPECPLEVVIVLVTLSINVCNIFKQKHKALQMVIKDTK